MSTLQRVEIQKVDVAVLCEAKSHPLVGLVDLRAERRVLQRGEELFPCRDSVVKDPTTMSPQVDNRP